MFWTQSTNIGAGRGWVVVVMVVLLLSPDPLGQQICLCLKWMVDSASNSLGCVVWWLKIGFRRCHVGLLCMVLCSTSFRVVQGGQGETGRISGVQESVWMG
jgi:hypothetical protein